jgi:hypothetical protein
LLDVEPNFSEEDSMALTNTSPDSQMPPIDAVLRGNREKKQFSGRR